MLLKISPGFAVRKRWTSASPAGRLSRNSSDVSSSSHETSSAAGLNHHHQIHQPRSNGHLPRSVSVGSGTPSSRHYHHPNEIWKSPPPPFVASLEPGSSPSYHHPSNPPQSMYQVWSLNQFFYVGLLTIRDRCKKRVFYKHKIKVCVSCGRCFPGTSVPRAACPISTNL